jgi:hypothetical protein
MAVEGGRNWYLPDIEHLLGNIYAIFSRMMWEDAIEKGAMWEEKR